MKSWTDFCSWRIGQQRAYLKGWEIFCWDVYVLLSISFSTDDIPTFKVSLLSYHLTLRFVRVRSKTGMSLLFRPGPYSWIMGFHLQETLTLFLFFIVWGVLRRRGECRASVDLCSLVTSEGSLYVFHSLRSHPSTVYSIGTNIQCSITKKIGTGTVNFQRSGGMEYPPEKQGI